MKYKTIEEALKLNESSELCKGIFWIKDLEDLENNKKYCVQIPCNSEGQSDNLDNSCIAKSGDTYNHERYWELFSKDLTENKPYNYYPRGRVEINRGKVTIYLNPNIATEEVKEFLIKEFNLTSYNGIKSVRLFPDGSSHYRCYLDE